LRGVVLDALRVELAALINDGSKLEDRHLCVALKKAFGRALCTRSASACLDVFALSNRIVSDLIRFRKLFEGTDQKLFLVVRKFFEIPLWSEVRCFVHARRLVAASQYFTDLFFPDELVHHPRTRAWPSRLRQFVEDRVMASLPVEYDSCIVDVAVQDDEILLIELNPFSKLTGSGLFDWTVDEDILQGRRDEFELRLVKKDPNFKLNAEWQVVVEEVLLELASDEAIEAQFEGTKIEFS
jgi:hypothetical protein